MTNKECAELVQDVFAKYMRTLEQDYTRESSVEFMRCLVAKTAALRSLGYMVGKRGNIVKFKIKI